MIHFYIGEAEFDWAVRTGLYALNAHSGIFENTSAAHGMFVRIYPALSDDEVLDELLKEDAEEIELEYLLYDDQHYLKGYVISPL